MQWETQAGLASHPFRTARQQFCTRCQLGIKEASLGHNFTPLQTYKHEAASPLGWYQTNPQPNLKLIPAQALFGTLLNLSVGSPVPQRPRWILDKSDNICLTFLSSSRPVAVVGRPGGRPAAVVGRPGGRPGAVVARPGRRPVGVRPVRPGRRPNNNGK